MLNICFYFQVHQPYRLRNYSFFDIGSQSSYFDDDKNYALFQRIAQKCYLPTNEILLEHLQTYPSFHCAFSFSGIFLEQCQQFGPQVLESFQRLIHTGKVELLAETYHHSLAFLYSAQEFERQINLHTATLQELFGVTPTILRNTELIYHNDLAQHAERMGFAGVLVEGTEKLLGWRSPNFVYQAAGTQMPLLMKNYRLSDDIAFRFSERSWHEWPLDAVKFARWINAIHGSGVTVNLFMDYETFGEHQWGESGIFEFLRHLPGELLKHPDTRFSTPSTIVKNYQPVGHIDAPFYVSWADIERDTSAWLGNSMQQEAARCLYELEEKILTTEDNMLINDWRKLQTSDHFYYMCTKWFNDGDVHKYFNPYESPYDGFIYFMNIYKDLVHRIDKT